MSILKLKPSCKDYLWGGHRLVDEYGKEYDGDILAETWELSCHPDGPSFVENGTYAGKTLLEYIEGEGREVLGNNCKRFKDFPILIKFIDARDNLSIQVHPDNAYALKNEGQYGKTEMWYVMDAEPGSFLYYGFKEEISEEEFAKRIEEDKLLEVLNAAPVKKGDVFFIKSGTIHAIGKGILIAEIQQNSNVTYRVYDYGRVGKDGKKRELHVDKAIAVTNRTPVISDDSASPHVADCDYFTVDKIDIDGSTTNSPEGIASDDSFVSILIMDGKGSISCDGEKLSFKKGESFFISAGSGKYVIEGECHALVTTVRAKENPLRFGIDIGGTATKIGIVDENDSIVASKKIETKSERKAEEVIESIANAALELLEENNLQLDRFVGAGVGVPGTVDRKNGVVKYSNNIKWTDVKLAKLLEKYLPIPIEAANDADCAALGEALAGAGKNYKNSVLITLGTGVGGGVIINGGLFSGSLSGGTEIGHMVISKDGEHCTCGRKGCLETYASATALVREAKKATGTEMLPEDIFAKASGGDDKLKEVVDSYIRNLGEGIVNVVNIFRPEAVIIGGGISAQGEALLTPVRDIVAKECFGSEYSEVPELITAKLGNDAGMIGAAGLVK